MTTTLRPAAPERRGADGSRARPFAVCVNGRPVGAVELATDPSGPDAGRIVSLHVDPPDRRRGRGTVAALAAEEVLRGWGCRRVEAAVPEGAPQALRLAAALGYVEHGRHMAKELPDTPPPQVGEVRPVSDAEFPAWEARARARHVETWTALGIPYERHRLPDGPHTADTALRVLTHRGTDIGWLWVRLRIADAPEAPAWVLGLEVAEEHRRRGHGRTLMLAAERVCLAAGVRVLGLGVLTANTPALGLYTSLGYRTTTRHLSKPLL